MKLSDIYNTILAEVNRITGQSYVLDRAPALNFSEGFSGTYRYIKPSTITKTRRSQGAPETVAEVVVGIAALSPSPTEIEQAEDELDALLGVLLRTAQIAPNVIILASSTAPTSSQYINEEGLDSQTQVLSATATVSIRGYY